MSVASPCEICRRAAVEEACDRCGKLVCEDHFDPGLGYCTECASEGAGGAPGREPDRLPDDVDTFRF